MTGNWLHRYLIESVREKLCTKIYCTTCGAMEFRLGVLEALAKATGQSPHQSFDWENATALTRALATVKPSDDEKDCLEKPVRCLLFDIWSAMRFMKEAEMERILAGSWGGEVLHRMQEHHKARLAEQRVRSAYDDPVNIQKRREEKKRLKQEQHQQRMALQKERNRIWREKSGKSDEQAN